MGYLISYFEIKEETKECGDAVTPHCIPTVARVKSKTMGELAVPSGAARSRIHVSMLAPTI